MENSDELHPLQILPHTEAVRQWNEDDGKSGQSVINIQPLPELNGGDVPAVNGSSNSFPIEAAVTIENNTSQANCTIHTVETHVVPDSNPTETQQQNSTGSTDISTDNATFTASIGNQVLAQVCVEGGGQHTVVVKTEPGLEEESASVADTNKQTEKTATALPDKQQPEPELGVVKAEKDTGEYEKSAAKNGSKSDSATSSTVQANSTPQAHIEYVPGSKVCTVCTRVLSNPEACVSHIANHGKDGFRMFICEVCGWAFESQMQHNVHKKKHMKSKTTTGAKPAAQSGTPSKAAEKSKESMEAENESASLTCLFCGRVMDSRDDLREHQERHCQEFNFLRCPSCDACYETEPARKAHRKIDHNDTSKLPDHMNDHYISYACKHCKRTFKTEGKLDEHEDNHANGTQLHQCTECGFCFEGQGDLKVHKRNKHKAKYGPKMYSVPCNECSRLFKTDVDMEKHLENHYNGTKLYVCSECGFSYENYNTYHRHKFEKHVKPNTPDQSKKSKQKKAELDPTVLNRSCQICERICPDEALKDAHVLNHHSNMPMITCESCPWQFEDQESYVAHKEENHKKGSGPGQHICNTCGRKFRSEDKKFAHIQNHENDVTMFKCDGCSFEFEDAEECAQHSHKCTNVKKVAKKETGKFACDYCGRKFQSETIKAMHMTKHLSNEPMHKCAECGWQFEQVHQMTYHLKTHSTPKKTPSKRTPKKVEKKEKPNTVCDQCERQFYYERQMKTHRENHFNGTNLVKCRYCPWEYENEKSIPRHVEQYHPYYAPKSEFSKSKKSGQKFVCPLCTRSFMGKVPYIQHLANHPELPYKCPYEKCGWCYSDYKLFQNHKNGKHNETKDNIQYRLEKMAEEATATGDTSNLEDSLNVLKESSGDPEKSISFALMCPRCKDWFDTKKELQNHTIKCKVSYTCGTCKLMFDKFNDFELHLFEDEMECEVCKKMFASECILQKHLVSTHFSADMIDESEKQQNTAEEEKKKAAAEAEKEKKKAAAEAEKEKKKAAAEAAKAEAKAVQQRKSILVPEIPKTPIRSPENTVTTPKSTRSSTRTRTAPSHTVTRAELEDDDNQDSAWDENLVSSTVDMNDDKSDTSSISGQKRKRVESSDSNNVDSSDDPASSKRRKTEDSLDAATAGYKIICEIAHCFGAFFEESIYMEHMRHIHTDFINIQSEDKYTIIQIKDASRANPTQRGPASKRKIWTVLRIQCQQGDCKDSKQNYYATRTLFNQHNADVHGGKRASEDDGKKSATPVKRNSIAAEVNQTGKSPDGKKVNDSHAQSTNPSPNESKDGSDEPSPKKKKNDDIKSMISNASFNSLLKDLDSIKQTAAKTNSPSKTSPRRGSIGAVKKEENVDEANEQSSALSADSSEKSA